MVTRLSANDIVAEPEPELQEFSRAYVQASRNGPGWRKAAWSLRRGQANPRSGDDQPGRSSSAMTVHTATDCTPPSVSSWLQRLQPPIALSLLPMTNSSADYGLPDAAAHRYRNSLASAQTIRAHDLRNRAPHRNRPFG